MKNIFLFTIFGFISFIFSEKIFDIHVSLINPELTSNLLTKNAGKLILGDNTGEIDSPQLLIQFDQSEIETLNCQDNKCFFLIKYIPRITSEHQFTNYYKHQLDLLEKKDYTEFIEVHVNSNQDIISLNYGIEELNKNSVQEQVVFIQSAESLSSELFLEENIVNPNEKKPEEQQSFFKKYFWWIVIGIVVMFAMNGQNPDKPQQQPAEAR